MAATNGFELFQPNIKWTAKNFPCDIPFQMITYNFKLLPCIYYMAFILQT